MKIEEEPRNRMGPILGERGTFLLFGRTFLQICLRFFRGELMIAINVMLSIIVLIGIVDIICLFGSKKKW